MGALPASHGRGMLRRLERASCTIFPTPPSSTIFLADSAKPVTISPVIFGGMDSAFGSVTTSTSAGPLVTERVLQRPAQILGFSTRTP